MTDKKVIKKDTVKEPVVKEVKFNSTDVVVCDNCGTKVFKDKGECRFCGKDIKKLKAIKE
jgi:ribosomal protein S26